MDSSTTYDTVGDFRSAVLQAVAARVVMAATEASAAPALPKFELHAHINGSIPLEVLRAFAEEDLAKAAAGSPLAGSPNDSSPPSSPPVPSPSGAVACAAQLVLDEITCFMTPLDKATTTAAQRMAHCFKVFDVVYRLVTTRQRLYAATRAVVRAFRDEGCLYVELRTTPKGLPDGTDDEGYVRCVLEAITDELEQKKEATAAAATATSSPTSMQCHLLLSINRRQGPDAAQRVVDLAVAMRAEQQQKAHQQQQSQLCVPTIVGLDFCGDCYARTFAEYAPVLLRAKHEHHFPLTLHMGEKDDDVETAQMLAVGPQRVGHCVFISEQAHEALRVRQVPIEICISSNMLTGGFAAPTEHHLLDWMRGARHPVTINTDDFGVFSTTLRAELMLFAEICFALWLEGAAPAKASQGGEASSEPSAHHHRGWVPPATTFEDCVRAIAAELFRVQFHAARCCFCPSEGERMRLLDTLTSAHEALWRRYNW